MKTINKIKVVALLLLITIMSCDRAIPYGQKAEAVATQIKGPMPTPNIVTYFSSHSRYAKNNAYGEALVEGGSLKKLVAAGKLAGTVAPSFLIISDGNTKVGGDPCIMPENYLQHDDLYAFTGASYHTRDDKTIDCGADPDYWSDKDNIYSGIKENPTLEYKVAIGGYSDPLDKDPLRAGAFIRLTMGTAAPAALDTFIVALKLYMKDDKYINRKPSGFAVDWEFPTTSAQAEGLEVFVKRLKKEFPDRKVSIAIGPNHKKHIKILDYTVLKNYVDEFQMMTYDYKGIWSTPVNLTGSTDANYVDSEDYTGHHTAVNSSVPSTLKTMFDDDKLHASVNVKYLIDQGVSSKKIKIGIAFYGRLFAGVDFSKPGRGNVYNPFDRTISKCTTVKTDTDKTKIPGKYCVGTMPTPYLSTIQQLVKKDTNFIKGFDTVAGANYVLNKKEKLFISYDDKESIDAKVKYVKDNKLGGVIIWEAIGGANSTIGGVTAAQYIYDKLKDYTP